jgi:hypothetical protein
MDVGWVVLAWFVVVLAVCRALWPPSKRALREPPPVCEECLAAARRVHQTATVSDTVAGTLGRRDPRLDSGAARARIAFDAHLLTHTGADGVDAALAALTTTGDRDG